MKRFLYTLIFCSVIAQAAVIDIDGQEELDAAVKKYPNIVLKFYRPGCPHCRTIAADYESISNSIPHVTFLAVDTAKPKNKSIFPQWNVKGVPTLFFVKNGQRTLANRPANFKSSFAQSVRNHFKD